MEMIRDMLAPMMEAHVKSKMLRGIGKGPEGCLAEEVDTAKLDRLMGQGPALNC